jgi:phosphate transport system permease protein
MALDPIASAAPVVAGAVRAGLAPRRRDLGGLVFQVLLLGSLLITLAILFTLVADVVRRALPVFLERGPGFLGGSLSSDPAKAGVLQGIFGTLGLGVMVAILAFPVGIATAIYLEEYETGGWFARFVQVNIRNLAGVPSVVYGLLGLAVFVPLFDLADGKGVGRNLLAGGLTLAVLVLPIVVITSIEALRAVPIALREAGYGVGASRWEVTSQLVLPAALPGILTGTVLALSRALGETAPLVLAGAVLGSFSGLSLGTFFTGSYTALPVIVYDWSRKPQDAFRADAAAAIVILLLITLLANALAILIRSRYDRPA